MARQKNTWNSKRRGEKQEYETNEQRKRIHLLGNQQQNMQSETACENNGGFSICNLSLGKYKVGEVVYVRETWCKYYYVDVNRCTDYDKPTTYYAADGNPDIGTLYDEHGFELDNQRIKWKSPATMPKEAARIFLRVTAVRVERVEDWEWVYEFERCEKPEVAE